MEDLTGFALDYIGGFLIGGRNGSESDAQEKPISDAETY